MTREYPSHPIAAVAGVVIRDDEVLLVRRGREPGLGLWSIPGGGVKLGEGLEAAVRREVLEETGLRVRPVTIVKVVERILPHEGRIRYHYVIIDYACTLDGGRLKPGSDAQDARWVPWSALDDLGLPQETLWVMEESRRILREMGGDIEKST